MVIWSYGSVEINLEVKHKVSEYLKGGNRLGSD